MTIYIGNAHKWLHKLPEQSVDCVVTSPPYYGLRDYGVSGQIGLEETPEAYIENMVQVFRGIRRVLKDSGSAWLNLGDSYWANRSENGALWSDGNLSKGYQARSGGKSHSTFKPKDLMMIPHRVAIALQMDGWWVRSDIVWEKSNPMPESVKDRPTKSKEYVFLLTKSERYFYDADAIREPHVRIWNENNGGSISTGRMTESGGAMGDMSTHPKGYPLPNPKGRNKRDVWTIATKPYSGAHFATMPQELAETCIKAGCPKDGLVLDPFGGAGTTALAAIKLGRKYQLIELNAEYVGIAQKRIQAYNPMQPTTLPDGSKQLSLFSEAS